MKRNRLIRKLLILSSSFIFSQSYAEPVILEDIGLSTPESVEYYAAEDMYLVTNINGDPFAKDDNGFISKISPGGEVIELKWINGESTNVTLNAPKGAAISGDRLYVADLDEVHILSTRHHGAVPGWPDDWVLELPCRVGRDGIQPVPTEPLPPACFGLLAQVKAYEILTAEAAVHGDRQAAYQALLVHPLGPDADKVGAVLDDLLETHRAHLPQFWGGGEKPV